MRFKLKIIYYWLKIRFATKLSSRIAIEKYQSKRLNRFANKTLSKSKFYQQYFVNKTFNWQSVPIIEKAEFMDSFDRINTCGVSLDEAMRTALIAEKSRNFNSEINGITVGLSTGTSGKRGLFLVSENERALWVAFVMHKVIKPKLFKKQKIAFFLRANSNLYASVKSFLFEFKYFDIFQPMSDLLKELNQFSPDILGAQPSVLIDIAEAKFKGYISINPIQIISFAEVLHENDKTYIKDIFKVPIKEVYQCTEGFLGVSCAYGTMHLNENFIKVEKQWIEEDKFYPIITDFSRQSQPIVKYKLNDVLEIRKTECPCGSKFIAIEKIIGRDDDVLIFDDIKVYPDIIARKIALSTNNFQKYSISQLGRKKLEVCIESKDSESGTLKQVFEETILSLLADQGIYNIELIFKNKVTVIQGNKMRKIKRINNED